MVVSIDLRVLAKKLEKSSDDLLVSASAKGPEIFEKVATAIAAASTLLEEVADDMDKGASFDITSGQLDEIAALASSFDESTDPFLKKQASVLDELLLSIAAPKNAVAKIKQANEEELKKLREERSKERREEAYDTPRKVHSDMRNSEQQAKAVEKQVKRYTPLEAPLSTRYPPDRPGGQMTRITDGVYQDIDTGIVYDYKNGYTTQKGNHIPGGCVENQTRQLGNPDNQSGALFETRDSIMGRYSSDEGFDHLKKYAMSNEISAALKAVRDLSPKLLNEAIDIAGEDGLSTSEIADVLSSDAASADDADWYKEILDPEDLQTSDTIVDTLKSRELSDEESHEEYQNAVNLFSIIRAAGSSWDRIIKDHYDMLEKSGLHQKHLSQLRDEFLRPEYVPAKDISQKQFEPSTASPQNGSLIALAINAIQEIAPHLLKSALDKAKQAGLTEEQIKTILLVKNTHKQASVNFLGETGEVKVAESLFPQLKALGWNSLISDHIKIMSSIGVSERAICSLENKFLPKKTSLSRLQNLLKLAGATEFELEEGSGPALELDIPEKEIEIDTSETPNYEFEGNVVPAPAYEEEELVTPDFEDEDVLVTPEMDSEKWWATYQELWNGLVKDSELMEKWRQDKVNGKIEFIALMNEKMNGAGFVGPGDKNPEGIAWLNIANKLKKGNTPAVKPKAEPKTTGLEEIKLTDKPPVSPGKLGPAKEQTPREQEAKRKSELGLNWDKYAEESGTNLTEDKIKKIETEVRTVFEKAKEAIDAKFNVYKYAGRPMPPTVGKLPREIFDKVIEKFQAEETSEGVSRFLQDYIPRWLAPQMEEEIEGYRNKLEVEMNDKLRKADEAEAEGKKVPAQTLRNTAAGIRKRMENDSVVAREALSAKMTSILPPIKDLHFARETVLGPQNLADAKTLRKEYLKNLSRQTINNILMRNALPPMYTNVDLPLLSDFEDKLKGLAVKTPGSSGRKGFIHPFPANLTPIWKDPETYVEAFLLSREMYGEPTPNGHVTTKNPEVKKKIDADMVEQGFVAPFEKLFGSTGSTANMLYGVYTPGNPMADFGGLKTLFSDPQEYVRKFVEGTRLFKTAGAVDVPKEWKQIHGGEPDSLGKTNSGDAIRRLIRDSVKKGLSVQEILMAVYGKFPDAEIPQGTIEKMIPVLSENDEIKDENTAKFNEWMRQDGFFPAHEPAIGQKSFAAILTGTGYRPKHAPDMVGGFNLEELKSPNYLLDKPRRGVIPPKRPPTRLPDGTIIPTKYQAKLQTLNPSSPLYRAIVEGIKSGRYK